MKVKFIAIFTLILGLSGSIVTAEEQNQAPIAKAPTTQEATAQASTPKSEPSTTEPKPVATLEKIPQKGGYALSIPSNIPGYEITTSSELDSVKYTLGPDDAIEVTVMRHPEFSGIFPINSEGKIQIKFVGDVDVKGLTKKQLEEKLVKIFSSYLVAPEVNVTITEYRSKYIFVLGEVGQPGKYYIRSETITVRDAVVNSGLPTYSAAMRKCSLITPDKSGKVKNRQVNIYDILYNGDLRKNIDMSPGDVLYVPATIMAKIIRVINPVATTVGLAASPGSDASTIKTSAKALAL